MKLWIKYGIYFVGFLGLGFSLSKLCDTQTKGFRGDNITSAVDFDSRWETKDSVCLEGPSEIQRILRSPFYFLAKGGSAYVFRSEDDKYVIKFFRAERLCSSWWGRSRMINFFIPNLCKQEIKRKQAQKCLQFSSYKLSQQKLQHQTGVVYLHLNSTSHHKIQMVLYDNIGIQHFLSADQTAFVLQKKAYRFSTYFKRQIAENNLEEAKRLLSEFVFFIKERAEKGIRDGDITPRYNMGMIEKSLVIFDIVDILSSLKAGDSYCVQLKN